MTSETLVETTNAEGYILQRDGSWLDPRTSRVYATINGGYKEIFAKGTPLHGDDPGPACPECGFGTNTLEHMRGKDFEGNGLHGHERTSKKVADEQRADAFARAADFAAAQEAESGASNAELEALKVRLGEAEARAEAAEAIVKRRDTVLGEMNRTSLLEVAAAEGVEVPDGASNAKVLELIREKRAGPQSS